MRKYIDILNESLTETATLTEGVVDAEQLLSDIVEAYDADQADLTEIIERAREFLGKTPPHKRSKAFNKGFRDATSGQAYDAPNDVNRADYRDGWALGRKRLGL